MRDMNLSRGIAVMAAVGVLGLAACSTDNPFNVSSVSATGTGNVADAPLSVTASGDGSKAGTSVTIPEDTILISESGAQLDPSSVTMRVEAFDGSEAAESVFEGGTEFVDETLISQVADSLGKAVNSTQTASIDIAGYAIINVSASGESVRQFNPPLTITINVPDLTPGSTAAIITVDEQTGVRRFEGTALVSQSRTITFQLDHLTVVAAVGNVANEGGTSGGSGG